MKVALLLLTVFLATGCEDEVTDESGFGTVVIHMREAGGGFASGVDTYIIKDVGAKQTERRVTSDAQGNATYENVPAGSWDAGFSENLRWVFGPPPVRQTLEVRNDATAEVTLFALRR